MPTEELANLAKQLATTAEELLDHTHVGTRLNTTATSFIGHDIRVHIDHNLEAPAAIQTSVKQISFNPDLIGEEAAKIWDHMVSEYGSEEAAADYLEQYTAAFNFGYGWGIQLLSLELYGLLLHELGHNEFTLPAKKCQAVIEELLPKEVPDSLASLGLNVNEDGYIQPAMLKKYPGHLYVSSVSFMQKYSQGCVEDFGKRVRSPEPLDTYSKLYYFILRAYNEYDGDVLTMWGEPDKFGYRTATLEAFDKAQSIVDDQKRAEYAVGTWIPMVYDDLMANMPPMPPTPPGGPNGPEGDGPDGPGGDPGEPGNKPKPGDKPGDKPDGKPGKTPGDQPGDTPSKEQGGKPTGAPTKNEKEQPQLTPEQLREKFKQEIEQAAQQILEELHEDSDAREIADEEVDQRSEADKENQIMLDSLCIAQEPLDMAHYSQEALDANTMQLYQNCAIAFSRIYSISDYTIHGLEDGEIDPLTLTTWYTEKNHKIYSREVQTTQGRTFQIIFILDRSGSMGGGRYRASANMIAAMCHAFQDVDIESAIYIFNSGVLQVKTVEERADLGKYSNVLTTIKAHSPCGCTNPSAAFDALKHDPIYNNDHTKIVFFITDGAMDNGNVEYTVNQVIKELTASGNWHFVGVGIDFSPSMLTRLKAFVTPGEVKSYTQEHIVNNLGEDITNLIIDNFIKV